MKGQTKKIELENLNENLPKKVDLFICSASFEERSMSIALSIEPKRVDKVIVFFNGDQQKLLNDRAEIIKHRFQSKATIVMTSFNDPLFTADQFVFAIEEIARIRNRGSFNIFLDITTFSHEALLILINILKCRITSKSIQIMLVYTAASEYSIGLEQKDKWLTKGVGTVRSILGYAGNLTKNFGLHLIIMMGFEAERVMKLIDLYEPTKVSLGTGKDGSAVHQKHFEVNQINFHKLPVLQQSVEKFEFSCTDPFETVEDLAEQVQKHSDMNIVIAALNTKLSTVGAGLFAMQNPDIQLCYASAIKYNTDNYSLPDSFCYLVNL